MSSSHSSKEPSSPGFTPPEPEAAVSGATESQRLLEEVLQATLQFSASNEALPAENLPALVAVARRRKDQPLTIEIVNELVDTVLRIRFRRVVESSTLWGRMTEQVATTIMDDPRTRDRMQSLWDKLCEAAS